MNVKLIIAAIVIALLNIYRIEASLIQVNPSSLSFDDYTNSTSKTISVTLDYAPIGNVHAAVTVGSGFSIFPCNVTFTPQNWNVAQIITVKSLPVLLSTGSQSINADIQFNINSMPEEGDDINNADGSLCKRTSEIFRISRTIRSSKLCTSNGDPHYTTFDGEYYTVSGKTNGYHYLVKTAETTVIEQQFQAYAGAILTNLKVAARHYDSYALIAIDETVISNSASSAPINHDKIFISGSDVTVTTNKKGFAYTINLADGSTVVASALFWGGPNKWYMNIAVRVPATYFGRTSGYCGNFNGLKETNLATTMATAVAPVVSAADNYFSCPGATIAEPMKGCTSVAKTSTCVPSKASVNMCDPIIVPVITSSVAIVKSSTSTAVAVNVPVATSTQKKSSTSTTTSIGSAVTSSVNVNKPAPTTTFVPVPSVEPFAPAPAPAPASSNFDETPFTQCFSATARPVTVAQLPVDETDVESYCTTVFQNMQCLGSSQIYFATCTDASLSQVQNHAQLVMNAAREDCSRHVKSLSEAQFKADRDYALILAAQYDIVIQEIDCNSEPAVMQAPAAAPTSTSSASSVSSVASPTDVSSDDEETNESSSNVGVVAIGVGSASAVLAVGAAIGGIIVFMRQRKQSAAKTASGKALAFENPLYGSGAKMHENLIYASNDATDVEASSTRTENTKRRTSLATEVLNRL